METKLYRPSNGTEGMHFIATYCENCIHEKWSHTQKKGDLQCEILSATMLYDLKDPEYPKEWIEEEGIPRCTAWVKWDWGNDEDGWNEPPTPEPEDPTQLCFPFILEFMQYEIYDPQPVHA